MAKSKKEVKDAIEPASNNNVDNSALDLVRKNIIKKYGQVVTSLAGEDESNEIKPIATLSTGCLHLDAALGRGGMAFGRIYEVFGPLMSGKSTLADSVVIQAQRRGLKCVYVDAEYSKDPELFINYGGNAADLEVVRGMDGEENLDILESLLRTGIYKVAVVDSVAALVPREEMEKGFDEKQMGAHARLMSKTLRKMNPMICENGILFIFINQVRLKVNGYGNPETTTGGGALGYYATGRITVQGPEAKDRRILGEDGEVIGHKSIFTVVKNKLSAPFRSAETNLIYGKGYDTHWEVLKLATSVGVIDRAGAWYKYQGENIAQGELNAALYLKDPENSNMFNEILKQVIEQSGLKEKYEHSFNPGPIYS